MAIKQLTVFVQNKKGTVVSVTEILSENHINLRALSIAETQDFGILRLIVNDENTAEAVLKKNGYLIKVIDVIGVKIGDEPGKLSEALAVLDKKNINVEYLYAFMARTEKHAYVVLRVEDNTTAEKALSDAGFRLISEEDINKL
ncbi:MAG: ACT domain-containing protein [Clostridia bacterium]|nr:ACT domain-containing protein [Clostridia bacterium]MBQ7407571.1 ACT domain-containing protein [Clostridia bacterium]MBQ8269477.1 ACT domain-containing protein [Clostridia bacterium]MBR2324862.1 ACT domain-containing protein [Clostridia bacterium]